MRLPSIYLVFTLISPAIVAAFAEPIIDDEVDLEQETPQFFEPFYIPPPFLDSIMLFIEPLAVPGIAPFGPPPLTAGKIMRAPGPPWQLHRMFFNPWTWDRFLWPARGLDGRPYMVPPPEPPPPAPI